MRSALFVFALLCAVLPFRVVQSAPVIRAVCRGGLQPFTWIEQDANNRSVCRGIMYEVFLLIMKEQNLLYELTYESSGSKAQAMLAVNNATNTSKADILVGFQTVAPDRLLVHDFAVALLQVDYTVVLGMEHRNEPPAISAVLFRDSVFFTVAALGVAALATALVLFVLEGYLLPGPDSEFAKLPTVHDKLCFALDASVELGLTMSIGSMTLSSHLARALRAMLSIVVFVLVTIFASLLTSQLTSSALEAKPVTLADLTGLRVGVTNTSVSLPFLALRGVAVQNGTDPENLATTFHGSNPDKWAGYCSTTPVVQYLRNKYGAGGGAPSFLSKPFFLGSNTYETKTFGISRALDRNLASAFNVGLQSIRDTGVFARIMTDFIPARNEDEPSADIPVDEKTFMVLKVTCAIGFGFVGMALIISFAQHCWRLRAATTAKADGGDSSLKLVDAHSADVGEALELSHWASGRIHRRLSVRQAKPQPPPPAPQSADAFAFRAGFEQLRDSLLQAGCIEVVAGSVGVDSPPPTTIFGSETSPQVLRRPVLL